MRSRVRVLCFLGFLIGCGGGCRGSSGPGTAPSTTGCTTPAVVSCNTVPGQPNLGQMTVAKGGSPDCNVGVNEAIPISFSILNPAPGFIWAGFTNTRQSVTPSQGSAATAGPFQVTAKFLTFGGDNTSTDQMPFGICRDNVTPSPGACNILCTVPLYGHN